MENLSSTFEKADSACNISAPPVHGQLTFIRPNALVALVAQCVKGLLPR
jgi:hypothetical protein